MSCDKDLKQVNSGLTNLACFISVKLIQWFIQNAGEEHFVWKSSPKWRVPESILLL